MKPLLQRYGPATAATVLLLTFVLRCLGRFAGAGHDDAYITLLAAKLLADGHGFVNFNGAPGEIGSSLLHVLILTVWRLASGFDLYLVNKLIGLLCGSATLLLVMHQHRRLFQGKATFAQAWFAAWLAAWLPTYGFWTMGGLETPIVALLLLALTCSLTRPSPWPVAATVGLLSLARPEGFTYLGVPLLFGLLTGRDRSWWLRAIGAPLLGFAAVSGARVLFVGYPVPLPVLAKAGGDGLPLRRFGSGVNYVVAFYRASVLGAAMMPAFVVRAVGLLRMLEQKRLRDAPTAQLAPALVMAVHLGDVIVAGGDWMAFYRFMAPIVPLMAVILAQVLWALAERAIARPRWRWGTALALTLLLPWISFEQTGVAPPYMPNTCMQRSLAELFDPQLGDTFGTRIRRLNHPHIRDETMLLPFIDGPLRPLQARHPTLRIASTQMGFLPHALYERGLRNIDLIDAFGITDPRLASVAGERNALGLTVGAYPERFLDPNSPAPAAQAIQKLEPDLVYTLSLERSTIKRLEEWGYRLIWSRSECNVFAHALRLGLPRGSD
ncbi:MAG: hypothetical protein OXU20_33590 [Myxococcales bacterium]|nr:hypothetical protein [Myxococcales bacterium]